MGSNPTQPKGGWKAATTVAPRDAGYPKGQTPAAERVKPVPGGKIPANTNKVR